ncbi:MAG TPA: RsmE family RNA methyltransferase [Bryobacteraceae bacterium]|nr:RsmE family RNA methyltransferase [Bryobacteraceae bacterium]
MARRRFFIDAVHSGRALLTGDDAKHLRQVLRAEEGQRYELCDNESVYLGEIDGLGREQVAFRILERLDDEALPVRLHLYLALIKFDRLEWAVEKATELGVERIVPIETARSEKGLERAAAKRVERWRKIARESAQQSRRSRLPDVTAPISFPDALKAEGLRLFLDEQPGVEPLLSVLPPERRPSDLVCLFAGPEGGWTDSERAQAAAAGCTSAGLGRLILRAETAAIAGLAIVSAGWSAS